SVRLTVDVITLQLQMRVEAVIGVDRQLGLLEYAACLVLVNVLIGAGDASSRIRPHAHQRSFTSSGRRNISVWTEGQRSINVPLTKYMNSTRIHVIDGQLRSAG